MQEGQLLWFLSTNIHELPVQNGRIGTVYMEAFVYNFSATRPVLSDLVAYYLYYLIVQYKIIITSIYFLAANVAEVEQSIKKLVDSLQPITSITSITQGQACMAKYHIDECWYRSVVVGLNMKTNKIKVSN